MTTSTCRHCGANYVEYAADGLCGRCKVRRKLGLPPPVPPLPRVAKAKAMPVYQRVRVTLPGSSRAGQVGLARAWKTRYWVNFGDGTKPMMFRSQNVEVLE